MESWNTLIKDNHNVDNELTSLLENIALSESPLGETHSVLISTVFQTEKGSIGAYVESETLAGNLLWLNSADFGPQNGLRSLLKATGLSLESSPDDLKTLSVKYTRVESDKSPVGYAHLWTV